MRPNNIKDCLHVRFCALQLISWGVNWWERRGQTAANHKQISCSIDYHEFATYTRMIIATCEIARVNRPLGKRIMQKKVNLMFSPKQLLGCTFQEISKSLISTKDPKCKIWCPNFYWENNYSIHLLFWSMNRFNNWAISSFSAKSCNAPGELGISKAEYLEARKIDVKTSI